MKAREIYFHDCRVLGNHIRIPRAMFRSNDTDTITAVYHKCPFCSATAGEMITDPKLIEEALSDIAMAEGEEKIDAE